MPCDNSSQSGSFLVDQLSQHRAFPNHETRRATATPFRETNRVEAYSIRPKPNDESLHFIPTLCHATNHVLLCPCRATILIATHRVDASAHDTLSPSSDEHGAAFSISHLLTKPSTSPSRRETYPSNMAWPNPFRATNLLHSRASRTKRRVMLCRVHFESSHWTHPSPPPLVRAKRQTYLGPFYPGRRRATNRDSPEETNLASPLTTRCDIPIPSSDSHRQPNRATCRTLVIPPAPSDSADPFCFLPARSFLATSLVGPTRQCSTLLDTPKPRDRSGRIKPSLFSRRTIASPLASVRQVYPISARVVRAVSIDNP